MTSMPSHCQTDYQSEVILHLADVQGGRIKFHADASEVEFERFRVPAAVALRMLDTVALLVGGWCDGNVNAAPKGGAL